MKLIVNLIEIACWLVLMLLGALVVGLGYLCIAPGAFIRWVGEWIVDIAGRFE